MHVTICEVVPFVDDTLPNSGAVKVGQDLATHDGAAADHSLLVLATPLHVIVLDPVSV